MRLRGRTLFGMRHGRGPPALPVTLAIRPALHSAAIARSNDVPAACKSTVFGLMWPPVDQSSSEIQIGAGMVWLCGVDGFRSKWCTVLRRAAVPAAARSMIDEWSLYAVRSTLQEQELHD
jgi:hypothetical protein